MANLLNKSTGSKNPVSGISASANHAAFIPELLAASGPFDFPMTNDYMFRAVLQSSNKALKGLLSPFSISRRKISFPWSSPIRSS